MKNIRVIINPVSGPAFRKREIIKNIEHTFSESAEIVFSRKRGDAGKLSANAVKKGFDAVVAVGGDGSVNECASALVHTNVALGIIPAGSGNGLARCMKIPFRTERAIECIKDFNIQNIDSIRINDRWVFSIAGFGLDARIAKLYAREKSRGFYPYLKLTLKEYLDFKPIPFVLRANNREISKNALFVSISNSNQFGYNTIIAEKARVDDGKADICIFEKVPLLQIPMVAPFFFLHKLDYTGFYESFQTDEMQVSYRKGKYMNIDGEAVKMKRKLNIKVHPASLKVIVPKEKG